MSERSGAATGRPFEVGPWRVDPGLDRLQRGAESVALEPRAMDLLVCLAKRAGETVTKETLLEEVWKGAFVIEGVIPKTLSALRAALGDDAAAPTFILTVPRRGYRLVAPVRWLPERTELPAAMPEPSPAAASAAVPALSPSALPWGHESPAAPAVVPGAAVADGGTAPTSRRVRLLTASLALAVAMGIGWLVFAAGERSSTAPGKAASPVSESVARLLLEARHLWSQRGLESVRRASELMEQAVKEAPASAEAHGWLALSSITRASYLGGSPSACDAPAEEARRAIALDPEDPIALCARGVIALQKDFDAAAGIVALERSVARDPTFVPARQFLAEALTIANRHERALEVIDQAVAIEPLSALLHGVRGNILLRLDRPLAALEAYERVLVLEPHFTWVYRNRARPLMELGRESEATDSLYTEARLTGERPEFLATMREAIDREGLTGYYRWRLGRLESMHAQGFEPRPFQLAEALAGAGRGEEALVELAKAPVCPDFDTFVYGRESPAFDALRDDPRFVAIYARLNS